MTYLTLRTLPPLGSCTFMLLEETADRSSAKLEDPAINACTGRRGREESNGATTLARLERLTGRVNGDGHFCYQQRQAQRPPFLSVRFCGSRVPCRVAQDRVFLAKKLSISAKSSIPKPLHRK
jgi:hypothetical protein